LDKGLLHLSRPAKCPHVLLLPSADGPNESLAYQHSEILI
jgi:hypothetical protein